MGKALAQRLADFARDGVGTVTVYLVGGFRITGDDWQFTEDEEGQGALLSCESAGTGVLHFVNPDHIVAMHVGDTEDSADVKSTPLH